MIDARPDFEQCYYEVLEANRMLDESIKSRDNTIQKLNDRIQQLEAEGSEIYNDRSMVQHISDLQQERINQLEAQLKESKAREGKGILERLVDVIAKAMDNPEMLKTFIEAQERRDKEEDHEEIRDTESE